MPKGEPSCCKCGKRAPLTITVENGTGRKVTKHYCDKHGKEVFRPLFWAEYGINYQQEKGKS